MASRDVKKTITLSTGNKISLPMGNQPQSIAVISANNRVLAYQGDILKRYSSNSSWPSSNVGGMEASRKVSGLGHANGCTYCDATNEIMVCDVKTKKVHVFDANSLKHKRNITLPSKMSVIAYDKVTGDFYTGDGDNLYVYSYKSFMSGKSHKKKFEGKNFKRHKWQDIGGYNGILYRVITASSGGENYMDAYAAASGKYLGSIKFSSTVGKELESCAIDENHNLHLLTLNGRYLINTKVNINSVFKGVNSDVNANKKVTTSTRKGSAAEAFVSIAKQELNLGVKESPLGSNKQKYGAWYGMNGQPWCAIFVCWCAHKTLGDAWTKTFEKNALAFGVGQGVVNKGGRWIKKASKGPTTHVGIIASVKNGTATTVEGNTGGDKVGSRSISVPSGTRPGDLIIFYSGSVGGIARPNWPGGLYNLEGGEASGGEGAQYGPPTLQVSPEKLYSSEQWKYEERKEEKEDESEKRTRELSSSLKDFLSNIRITNPTYKAIPDINLPSIYKIPKQEKKVTKISGNIQGSTLPSTINYVEAPYVNINIGGVSIGTYKNENYPNYITNLSAKKTNGSLNEYTINLSHQISPGDNPNYIDNLISANGYNKIRIEYGDAESGVAFRSSEALLTNVRSNFDFFNNIINYTLTATSSAVMSSISKRTYPAVTEKPSVLINNMLYKTNELLEYFPGMRDKSFVNSNNLIPSTDKQVEFSVMENVTPMEYLTTLVSVMSSVSNNSSVYFLDIKDDAERGAYFQIKEVKTSVPGKSQAFMYEVDINYPNENSLVYNFSVNEDFAWPLAYEYSGRFTDYKYNIDNSGGITATRSTSNLKNITSTTGVSLRDKNWWKNVTEFPIGASLEIKGLSTYILLLNYIKINVYYFGKKRSSSGVYIVTGQEDSLSGNGFITRLDLLRVAGDNQYISIDGRVAT